jgi:hypothetical protein
MRRYALVAVVLAGCFHPIRPHAVVDKLRATGRDLATAMGSPPPALASVAAPILVAPATRPAEPVPVSSPEASSPPPAEGTPPADPAPPLPVTTVRTEAPTTGSVAHYTDAAGAWQCRSFASMRECMDFCRPVPLGPARSCNCTEDGRCG